MSRHMKTRAIFAAKMQKRGIKARKFGSKLGRKTLRVRASKTKLR